MRTDREVFGEKTAPGDFLPVFYHELNINGEARGGGGKPRGNGLFDPDWNLTRSLISLVDCVQA